MVQEGTRSRHSRLPLENRGGGRWQTWRGYQKVAMKSDNDDSGIGGNERRLMESDIGDGSRIG